MLADEITRDLRAIRAQAVAQAQQQGHPVTRSLVSKGIGYGTITGRPDGCVVTTHVQGVDPDLRVRPFFHHGGTISIREFVVGAFDAEMGLQAFDPDLVAARGGASVVTPSGMVLDGSRDAIEAPPVGSASEDQDQDGVSDEIPVSIVDYMEFYLLNYFKPGTGQESMGSHVGMLERQSMGCTACHAQSLTVEHDRRVADVETRFDPSNGNPFNRMFATAAPRFVQTDDGSGHPPLKRPSGRPFVVRNIFTDFKRHDLGPAFHERNYDGSLRTRFLTTALWGVGSTGPYGHDGRSMTLRDVILRHGGEAQVARNRFAHAHPVRQNALIEFLGTLVLFPPDDTASNLQPAAPDTPRYPQIGHGSIRLGALFNDLSDPE